MKFTFLDDDSTVLGKRKAGEEHALPSVRISEISTRFFMGLIRELGLYPVPIEYNHPSSKKVTHTFRWNPKEPEDTQMDPAIKWMKEVIALPRNMRFDKITDRKNSLTLAAGVGGYFNQTIKGTADVVIVNKDYVGDITSIAGAHVIFELKKQVPKQGQAYMETVLANILSMNPVLGVQTDLRNMWFFYWMEEGKKIRRLVCKNLGAAIAIIEDALRNGAPKNYNKPGVPPYAKRVSIPVSLGRVQREIGEYKKLKPENVLDSIRNRSKLDLDEDNDVARMEDVMDVMTKDEIIEWRLKYFKRVVENNPILWKYCESSGKE